MNVIPPITVNDANLVTNVPETAPAAYNAGTTYGLGDKVSVAGALGLLTVYESLQVGNIGHTPASSPTWWEDCGETYQVYSGAATYAAQERVIDPTTHTAWESLVAGNTGNALSMTDKWFPLGATNTYAMFDLFRNTATVSPRAINVEVTPGARVNSFYLSVLATEVNVVVTSSGMPVYTKTYDLLSRVVLSHYDYWYAPFVLQPSIIEFDLPPFSNAVVSIEIINTTGPAECSACVLGSFVNIGKVEYNAESDTLNFSTVERDFAGNVSKMVPLRNVPRTQQTLFLHKDFVNRARALRDSLGGIPAVWAGLTDDEDGYFESLLIVGFYKRFGINLKHHTMAEISLELEEI